MELQTEASFELVEPSPLPIQGLEQLQAAVVQTSIQQLLAVVVAEVGQSRWEFRN